MSDLAERFVATRARTIALTAPLAVEDHVVQSMPDASPVTWHLAHTTWFFETFVLVPLAPSYRPVDSAYGFLFNSYYDAVGPRHPRPHRGLLTRPTVAEVHAYRRAVDEAMVTVLEHADAELAGLVELGIHHEQQHQELILTDLQHALSMNPMEPVYRSGGAQASVAPRALEYAAGPSGVFDLGHAGPGFAFDNEGPRHRVQLVPYAVATRLVCAGEYLAFIEDGGYQRPSLWLSDGFAMATAEGWSAPLYWAREGATWTRFSLHGRIPIDEASPVVHVSYYEADAYARWAGARLATEAEWEALASRAPVHGQLGDDGLVPRETGSMFGSTWVWTSSAYAPYPGYAPAKGALGEYNGKFMCNQMVLRGGSCFTPRSHVRASYRNFFPPHARWQVTGIRLAR